MQKQAEYKTSKGFKSPNFTQIPNDFFALAPDMGLSELQILLYLMRETFGWHRPQTTITIRQLARSTGLSTRSIVDGAAKLEDRGLIRRIITPNKVTIWECVVESSTSALYFLQHRVLPGKSKPKVKESIKKDSNIEEEDQTQNIFTLYEQEIGVITPMIADALEDWEISVGPLWVSDAFKLAVKNNARSWAYCEAILKRWKAQGNQNDNKKAAKTSSASVPKGVKAVEEWLQESENNGE